MSPKSKDPRFSSAWIAGTVLVLGGAAFIAGCSDDMATNPTPAGNAQEQPAAPVHPDAITPVVEEGDADGGNGSSDPPVPPEDSGEDGRKPNFEAGPDAIIPVVEEGDADGGNGSSDPPVPPEDAGEDGRKPNFEAGPDAIIPVVQEDAGGSNGSSDPPIPPEDAGDDDGAKGPAFEVPETGGIFDNVPVPIPDLPPLIPDLAGDLVGVIVPGVRTIHIDPADGGSVEQSIFRLDVPSGALNAAAHVQMTVESATEIKVHLGPDGLQFDKPAELLVDLSGIVGKESGNYTMFWWDPDANEWVNVGGDWNPETRVLRAAIWHFSDYAPGRAGWNSGGKKPVDNEKDDKK